MRALIVRVVYFAAAREAASTDDDSLTLIEGARISDLAQMIRTRHPSMAKVLVSARYSVNLTLVGDDTTLQNGDEVGVLPPVAGG